jgi:Holliday junction resolvasome RuvABC DNA-binding subunit
MKTEFEKYKEASEVMNSILEKTEKKMMEALIELGFRYDDAEDDTNKALNSLGLVRDLYHANMHYWRKRK